MNEYFRLFPSCVVVKGAAQSVICDLQRKSVKSIPNTLVDVLAELSSGTVEDVRSKLIDLADKKIFDEYLEMLLENELGFLCSPDEIIHFPEIIFKTSQVDQNSIDNAIIDVSPSSCHDYEIIFFQLEKLGCKHIQIRNYEKLSFVPLAIAIMEAAEKKRFKSIDFLFAYDEGIENEDLDRLCYTYPRINEIVIHSAPVNRIQKTADNSASFIYITEQVNSEQHCGMISPYYFSISLKNFAKAKTSNNCLSGKISIDAVGNIKNCPSMPQSYGHVGKTKLEDVISNEKFKKMWSIHKDQVSICKDCEYRYICSDCRAYVSDPNDILSKPSKCSYDPYTATWG